MSEMIERVARAIMDADGDPKGCEIMEYQMRRARAAIEAMREPTAAMRQAASHDLEEFDPGIAWRTMMDAALGNK